MLRFLLFALVLALAACNSSGGSGGSAGALGDQAPLPPASLKIDLADVSGACLNLETYFQRIRSLPSNVAVRKFTTDMSFKATGNSIPRNFLLRLAAGNFEMSDVTLGEVPDFVDVRQTACEKVTMRIEGRDEVYKIARASKDSLTLLNDWSLQKTFTWKGSNHLQIETISTIGDYLCDPRSKGRLQTISDVSWGNADIFTAALPAGSIDSSYVKMVIEATNYPNTVTTESNQLVVDRLKELRAWPVRVDLYQCY